MLATRRRKSNYGKRGSQTYSDCDLSCEEDRVDIDFILRILPLFRDFLLFKTGTMMGAISGFSKAIYDLPLLLLRYQTLFTLSLKRYLSCLLWTQIWCNVVLCKSSHFHHSSEILFSEICRLFLNYQFIELHLWNMYLFNSSWLNLFEYTEAMDFFAAIFIDSLWIEMLFLLQFENIYSIEMLLKSRKSP